MRFSKTVFYAVAMALCVTSCNMFSSKPEPISAEKIAQARKYVQTQVIHQPAADASVKFRVFAGGSSTIKNVDITARKIKIVTDTAIAPYGSNFALSLKRLNPAGICDAFNCVVSINPRGDLYYGDRYSDYELMIPKNDLKSAADKVHSLTYALSILQQAASQERSENPEFKHVVDNYRALPTKPALPEDAGRLKTQAEDAVRDRKFDDAADDYSEALDIAPWWPEGHRSLAATLAELNDYYGAIDAMKCYLLLAPDASDAQASQDKIKEWEQKIPKRK